MPIDYKEKAFETAIEAHLLGKAGYAKADPNHFDRERALDPTILLSFIEQTQPETWAALSKLHGPNTKTVVCTGAGGAGPSGRWQFLAFVAMRMNGRYRT